MAYNMQNPWVQPYPTTTSNTAGSFPTPNIAQAGNYPVTNFQPGSTINTYQWVQGEEAAKALPVAPGTEVMLMDSEAPVIYKKSADASGRPILRIFDMVERLPNQSQNEGNFVTKDELTSAVEEAVRNAMKHNRKEKTNG